MFEITGVRHMYPEPAEFFIDRRLGHPRYTFLHFHNSVRLRVGGEELVTQPHAVVLYAPSEPQYFYSPEPLLHDWFHFSGNFEALPLEEFRSGKVFYPSCHEQITRMVAQVETEFFSGELGSPMLSDCKIKELFITLDRDLCEDGARLVGSETLKKFRYLRGEMFSSLNQHHSIESLAEKAGLSKDSVVLLEQVRTLDKRRLKEKMGHLDDEVMRGVNSAIAVSFGLDGGTRDAMGTAELTAGVAQEETDRGAVG